MDEDDDPETNQAGRSVNEPNNSSQMPFSAPPEKEDPSAKRETEEGRKGARKRNASDPIQSSAKVADEKKTPTSIATSAPKGMEGAPPATNLMETSDWAEEMAEELGRITVRASEDPAPKSAGETANPITWTNVTEDLPYAVAIHGGQVDRRSTDVNNGSLML